MDKTFKKIQALAEKRVSKGEDMKDVAFALFRAGIEMMRDGTGEDITEAVVRRTEVERKGREPAVSMSVESAYPGAEVRIVPTEHPTHADLVEMDRVIRYTARLLDGYARHHLAKSPPDLDKARRNTQAAAKLYDAVGVVYEGPMMPPQDAQEAAKDAQERDLLPDTGERPSRVSDAPLDRRELLDWFDLKLDGCAKNGMREASDVLQAFRNEVAQHIEAAPIDFAETLRAFYADVHDRNVRAGWWSDLATNKPKKRSVGELFILFVTELVEAYDAYLTGEMDNKLTDMPGLGVELGDLQIRLADFCGALQAGKIVEDTDKENPGTRMFHEVCHIAHRYEAIRKTPEAIGEPETGNEIAPQDVAGMIVAKLEFNATRPDHKIENRLKEDGKRT